MVASSFCCAVLDRLAGGFGAGMLASRALSEAISASSAAIVELRRCRCGTVTLSFICYIRYTLAVGTDPAGATAITSVGSLRGEWLTANNTVHGTPLMLLLQVLH